MSRLCLILAYCLFSSVYASRFPDSDLKAVVLHYDTSNLVLPGSKIPIGIQLVSFDRWEEEVTSTRGLLRGDLSWRKLDVTVKGGEFKGGKILIDNTLAGFPGDHVTVHIRDRKSGELLHAEDVFLNYPSRLEVIPTGEVTRAPGNSFRFAIMKEYDNKERVFYQTTGQLRKELSAYSVYTEGGTLTRNNEFTMFDDPDRFYGHRVTLGVRHQRFPWLDGELAFLLDYIDDYRFDFHGRDGFSGMSGASGCLGTNGWHGQDGGDGEHGPDIFIDGYEYFDEILSTYLLRLKIYNSGNGQERTVLMNGEGGATCTIRTTGGDGGFGGSGGNGGDGRRGRDGTKTTVEVRDEVIEKDAEGNEKKVVKVSHKDVWGPGGDGGSGGHGGNGGFGGFGGDGGNIELVLDSDYYVRCFYLESRGGSGGRGGFGGAGGRGGQGGYGSPNGAPGLCGSSGISGQWGWSGSPGRIVVLTPESK